MNAQTFIVPIKSERCKLQTFLENSAVVPTPIMKPVWKYSLENLVLRNSSMRI